MGQADAVKLVAVSLAALAVAVIAQTVFMIATYASYARKDTRTPLRSMMVQAATCLTLASMSLFMHGPAVLAVLGAAFSVSISVAAVHLSAHLRRQLGSGHGRLASSILRTVAGAAAMIGPAWLTATVVRRLMGAPMGQRIGILAAAAVGGLLFVVVQAMLRTPELAWLSSGLSHVRRRGGGEGSDA
jgi:peptidoglycan biosynthesis protein MviN/MurJ (putative lipid II flippase)